MTHLKQYTEKEGYRSLTEEGDLTYIEFGIVSLKAGSSFRQEEQKGKETGLILLKGEGEIKTGGKTGFRREVYDIIDERVNAEKLIIGETINFPGEWSSFPPHKHDKDNLPEESKLEEFYLFKIEPEEGFGLTRLYTAESDLDTAYVIRNNSFLLIPRGYHPIAAIPGYKLYYLWILAGEGRKLVPNDDPAFKWLK